MKLRPLLLPFLLSYCESSRLLPVVQYVGPSTIESSHSLHVMVLFHGLGDRATPILSEVAKHVQHQSLPFLLIAAQTLHEAPATLIPAQSTALRAWAAGSCCASNANPLSEVEYLDFLLESTAKGHFDHIILQQAPSFTNTQKFKSINLLGFSNGAMAVETIFCHRPHVIDSILSFFGTLVFSPEECLEVFTKALLNNPTNRYKYGSRISPYSPPPASLNPSSTPPPSLPSLSDLLLHHDPKGFFKLHPSFDKLIPLTYPFFHNLIFQHFLSAEDGWRHWTKLFGCEESKDAETQRKGKKAKKEDLRVGGKRFTFVEKPFLSPVKFFDSAPYLGEEYDSEGSRLHMEVKSFPPLLSLDSLPWDKIFLRQSFAGFSPKKKTISDPIYHQLVEKKLENHGEERVGDVPFRMHRDFISHPVSPVAKRDAFKVGGRRESSIIDTDSVGDNGEEGKISSIFPTLPKRKASYQQGHPSHSGQTETTMQRDDSVDRIVIDKYFARERKGGRGEIEIIGEGGGMRKRVESEKKLSLFQHPQRPDKFINPETVPVSPQLSLLRKKLLNSSSFSTITLPNNNTINKNIKRRLTAKESLDSPSDFGERRRLKGEADEENHTCYNPLSRMMFIIGDDIPHSFSHTSVYPYISFLLNRMIASVERSIPPLSPFSPRERGERNSVVSHSQYSSLHPPEALNDSLHPPLLQRGNNFLPPLYFSSLSLNVGQNKFITPTFRGSGPNVSLTLPSPREEGRKKTAFYPPSLIQFSYKERHLHPPSQVPSLPLVSTLTPLSSPENEWGMFEYDLIEFFIIHGFFPNHARHLATNYLSSLTSISSLSSLSSSPQKSLLATSSEKEREIVYSHYRTEEGTDPDMIYYFHPYDFSLQEAVYALRARLAIGRRGQYDADTDYLMDAFLSEDSEYFSPLLTSPISPIFSSPFSSPLVLPSSLFTSEEELALTACSQYQSNPTAAYNTLLQFKASPLVRRWASLLQEKRLKDFSALCTLLKELQEDVDLARRIERDLHSSGEDSFLMNTLLDHLSPQISSLLQTEKVQEKGEKRGRVEMPIFLRKMWRWTMKKTLNEMVFGALRAMQIHARKDSFDVQRVFFNRTYVNLSFPRIATYLGRKIKLQKVLESDRQQGRDRRDESETRRGHEESETLRGREDSETRGEMTRRDGREFSREERGETSRRDARDMSGINESTVSKEGERGREEVHPIRMSHKQFASSLFHQRLGILSSQLLDPLEMENDLSLPASAYHFLRSTPLPIVSKSSSVFSIFQAKSPSTRSLLLSWIEAKKAHLLSQKQSRKKLLFKGRTRTEGSKESVHEREETVREVERGEISRILWQVLLLGKKTNFKASYEDIPKLRSVRRMWRAKKKIIEVFNESYKKEISALRTITDQLKEEFEGILEEKSSAFDKSYMSTVLHLKNYLPLLNASVMSVALLPLLLSPVSPISPASPISPNSPVSSFASLTSISEEIQAIYDAVQLDISTEKQMELVSLLIDRMLQRRIMEHSLLIVSNKNFSLASYLSSLLLSPLFSPPSTTVSKDTRDAKTTKSRNHSSNQEKYLIKNSSNANIATSPGIRGNHANSRTKNANVATSPGIRGDHANSRVRIDTANGRVFSSEGVEEPEIPSPLSDGTSESLYNVSNQEDPKARHYVDHLGWVEGRSSSFSLLESGLLVEKSEHSIGAENYETQMQEECPSPYIKQSYKCASLTFPYTTCSCRKERGGERLAERESSKRGDRKTDKEKSYTLHGHSALRLLESSVPSILKRLIEETREVRTLQDLQAVIYRLRRETREKERDTVTMERNGRRRDARGREERRDKSTISGSTLGVKVGKRLMNILTLEFLKKKGKNEKKTDHLKQFIEKKLLEKMREMMTEGLRAISQGPVEMQELLERETKNLLYTKEEEKETWGHLFSTFLSSLPLSYPKEKFLFLYSSVVTHPKRRSTLQVTPVPSCCEHHFFSTLLSALLFISPLLSSPLLSSTSPLLTSPLLSSPLVSSPVSMSPLRFSPLISSTLFSLFLSYHSSDIHTERLRFVSQGFSHHYPNKIDSVTFNYDQCGALRKNDVHMSTLISARRRKSNTSSLQSLLSSLLSFASAPYSAIPPHCYTYNFSPWREEEYYATHYGWKQLSLALGMYVSFGTPLEVSHSYWLDILSSIAEGNAIHGVAPIQEIEGNTSESGDQMFGLVQNSQKTICSSILAMLRRLISSQELKVKGSGSVSENLLFKIFWKAFKNLEGRIPEPVMNSIMVNLLVNNNIDFKQFQNCSIEEWIHLALFSNTARLTNFNATLFDRF